MYFSSTATLRVCLLLGLSACLAQAAELPQAVPPTPENITCISEGWRNMHCTWDTGMQPGSPRTEDTTWTLYWSIFRSRSFYLCPHPVGPNQCQWRTPDGLDSFRDGMIYMIVVGAKNSYGNSWSTPVWIDTKTIVKPDPVTQLSASPVDHIGSSDDIGATPAAIEITWSAPDMIQGRLSLLCQVKVTSSAQSDGTLPIGGDNLMKVIETNKTTTVLWLPQIPSDLDLEIRAIPERGGYWSEAAIFRISCFRGDMGRDVTLYCITDDLSLDQSTTGLPPDDNVTTSNTTYAADYSTVTLSDNMESSATSLSDGATWTDDTTIGFVSSATVSESGSTATEVEMTTTPTASASSGTSTHALTELDTTQNHVTSVTDETTVDHVTTTAGQTPDDVTLELATTFGDETGL